MNSAKVSVSQNHNLTVETEMIKLGVALKHVRDSFDLSQRAAAQELGVTSAYLCRLENGQVAPTATMIDRIYDVWGIDLYVMAACMFSDENRFPSESQMSIRRLKDSWAKEIDRIVQKRNRNGTSRNSENRVASGES